MISESRPAGRVPRRKALVSRPTAAGLACPPDGHRQTDDPPWLCDDRGSMSIRRFRRTLSSLQGIFEFVAEFMKANGLDAAQAFEVDLVIEELFTNQVKYNAEASHEVEVRLEREGPAILVILRDFDVEPFDLTQAPEVDVSRPLGERQTGGLGLHLVRQIAESVRYEHRDRCSTITVTLRLEP